MEVDHSVSNLSNETTEFGFFRRKKMAPLISSLSVLVLCCFTSAIAENATCSITRFGGLTMFNGEHEKVELPCKYRLAEFTCGTFQLRVTPGSSADGKRENRFSPDTVWVRISKVTNGRYWVGRTSSHILAEANDTTPVWVEKGGDLYLEGEAYDPASQTAVLERSGVFRIAFSIGGDQAGVSVTCASDSRDFAPGVYPKSLCGDVTTVTALKSRRQHLFGETTEDGSHSLTILHDVLDNDVVTQSEICQGVAAEFKSCDTTRKAKAARVCGPVIASRRLAFCLLDDMKDVTHFDNCMAAVCHDDVSACRLLKNAVDKKCPELASSSLAELEC